MGPGAPEGYWMDAENIKRELQVFFSVRAVEEQRLLDEKSSNPLRNYLGLADVEQKRIRKRDVLIDRDLYSDLRRHGFDYLVLPIMEQGGFRAFAAMFAIRGDQPPRQEDTGGLALGAALEAKLGTLSDKVSAAQGKEGGWEGGERGEGVPVVLTANSPSYMRDDEASLDPAGWKKGKSVLIAPAKPKKYWGKQLLLSNPSKLYSALLLLDLAVGFGRSTTGALDRGFLTPSLLNYVQLAAEVGVLANMLSAPLTFLFVTKAGKPWEYALPLAVKALMGGPVAMVEYRLKGEFGGDSSG
eukprot:evm.model.NODE_1128_length_6050_cov_29.238678.2